MYIRVCVVALVGYSRTYQWLCVLLACLSKGFGGLLLPWLRVSFAPLRVYVFHGLGLKTESFHSCSILYDTKLSVRTDHGGVCVILNVDRRGVFMHICSLTPTDFTQILCPW